MDLTSFCGNKDVNLTSNAAVFEKIPVEITYTADNRVSRLWRSVDNGTFEPLAIGSNATNWQVADTFSILLEPYHTYQLVWQVINGIPGGPPPGEGNPGSFLCQISQNPFISGSLYSSSQWEVAYVENNLNIPSDFYSLNWVAASEYGANGGLGVIWTNVNGGPIQKISTQSRWIWTAANFGDIGAPDITDSVFIRVTIKTSPSAAGILLNSLCDKNMNLLSNLTDELSFESFCGNKELNLISIATVSE